MSKKQLIIIGAGVSVSEGISQGLWDKLAGKYVFGLNYSYHYFPNPTVQLWVDKLFYDEEKDKMVNIPLVIGKTHGQQHILKNTRVFKTDYKYQRDLSKGIYKETLCGLFALSLAIYLLDIGEIYLLGFDYGSQGKPIKKREHTHFYQEELNHRGIGKTSYYDGILQGNPRADKDFGVYKNEKKVKIYNVSPFSNINEFTKLTYKRFFEHLDNKTYDQDKLREEIYKKLEVLK